MLPEQVFLSKTKKLIEARLCEGTAVGIPLCAKGCESSIDFFFTDFKVSGKQRDLFCFGVNFNEFVKVKVDQ